MDDGTMVKVEFKVDPPAGGIVGETMWAKQVGAGRFRLRNTPFLAYGVSFGDVVFAVRRRGRLVFHGVSIRGGHSTFWVKVEKGREAEFPPLWKRLKQLGCSYESDESIHAIDVPASARFAEVQAILDEGLSSGVWIFEEAHCGHPVVPGPETGRDGADLDA